ncbi:hypothetical protein Dform_01921 [Dehalogenimonas formicexedens]|uniref:Uncharacterized protein n=1 Tax=Dehalogenimonas formicexedens TaxID=1839801 RepID=A0A1P8F9U3_9CHLR|nr:hypothetical protein [Dehalogenimonas formicexedens]APV45236.1 hypothetical protein Dform_01921 [Dehalogenimonas formicexedens]
MDNWHYWYYSNEAVPVVSVVFEMRNGMGRIGYPSFLERMFTIVLKLKSGDSFLLKTFNGKIEKRSSVAGSPYAKGPIQAQKKWSGSREPLHSMVGEVEN